MWTPISLGELEELVLRGELKLEDELLNFWNLIKIAPRKWQGEDYGDEGGGFWVVAYLANQYELDETVIGLYERIKRKK